MSAPPETLPLDVNPADHEADEPTFELESDVSGKPRVKKLASAISGRRYRKRQMVRIDSLRPSLAERIRRDHPDLPENARISLGELARYQMLYVEELLQQEHGEFSELDRQVAESIANQDTIAENIEDDFEEHRTFGERLSDHLASFGGSWKFLLSFAGFLAVWMAYNIVKGDAFDPYPFILLNLVLSTLAAIQAPVIMMSQKRQEEKDRQRSFNDYRVNLKAELEIRHLHEKIDYLISRQWQRLSEIQQVQIEMLQQGQRKKLKSPKTEGTRYREPQGRDTE
ncbi:putative membrane protein [Rhodoblastus acidophilus]|uniref:DUF1003 domain-containing protein n=1 Tax=Rhodoblastus acidophilus TaxID=1074 RepID=UPI0022244F99|nr:DUF1003 domain-containing protein [Rhodoblastus acidophilus]MCW2282819.1 putative membrane protein [Rhodoblastus acidophilus]MCW2331680.1 putative membrane protein [Rhodoblastus acidophilus]